MQEELGSSNANLSSLERQAKVKADEWTIMETRLKEEIRQWQDRISHTSRDLEDAKDVQAQLKKSLDETKTQVNEWKTKNQELESNLLETKNLSQSQVNTF